MNRKTRQELQLLLTRLVDSFRAEDWPAMFANLHQMNDRLQRICAQKKQCQMALKDRPYRKVG